MSHRAIVPQTPPRNMEISPVGISIVALVIGAFLAMWAYQGTPSVPAAVPNAQPPIYETLAAAQLAALTPAPTDIPTSTATSIVAPTDTPATRLDWCSHVAIQTPCSLPPAASTLVLTPLVSCELKTPSSYIQTCTKTDGMGTNGRDQTH